MNHFISILPENYQKICKIAIKLKRKGIQKLKDDEIIFWRSYYIDIYINKFFALLICCYHLDILESIDDDIIITGFDYYSKEIDSFENYIWSILSKGEYYVMIPIEFKRGWDYIEHHHTVNIYRTIILALIKLNLWDKINIDSIINGTLEYEIFKLFNIDMDIILSTKFY